MAGKHLTGAQALVAALVASESRYVFGNPGTTEQAFLDALGCSDDIDFVVALHEGVAVGAAEGYARASGQVGVVQLHTGCGLGNAMGMLLNADVGRTPLVVLVGASSSVGAHAEPALGGDLVAIADPVARWAWEIRTSDEIPVVIARAFKTAATSPQGPVVISLPNDLMDLPCEQRVVEPSWVRADVVPSRATIVELSSRLWQSAAPALLIGDGVSTPAAGALVARIAELIGAPIYSTYLTQAVLPNAHPLDAGELPLFDAEMAKTRVAAHDLVLAVGADVLRSVFPTAGPPLGNIDVIHVHSDPWQLGKSQPSTAVLGDEEATLGLLIDALVGQIGATVEHRLAAVQRRIEGERRTVVERFDGDIADQKLTTDSVMAALASVLPDSSVLIDESVSAMPSVGRRLPRRPGGWFRSRGGGLGAGMSLPVGVALARPGERVVAVVGDGASMYTLTALWTAARWRLPITWIIVDNGGYRILETNTKAWRGGLEPDRPVLGTDLGDPAIDIAGLALAFGVVAHRVTDLETLTSVLPRALEDDPCLVHVVLDR